MFAFGITGVVTAAGHSTYNVPITKNPEYAESPRRIDAKTVDYSEQCQTGPYTYAYKQYNINIILSV